MRDVLAQESRVNVKNYVYFRKGSKKSNVGARYKRNNRGRNVENKFITHQSTLRIQLLVWRQFCFTAHVEDAHGHRRNAIKITSEKQFRDTNEHDDRATLRSTLPELVRHLQRL